MGSNRAIAAEFKTRAAQEPRRLRRTRCVRHGRTLTGAAVVARQAST